MRLAHPWALALAPLAWALAAAVLLRARPAALSYPAAEGLRARRPSRRARLSRAAPVMLPAAALTLMAFALARPQAVRPLPADDARGVDIVLAIDSSLSMAAADLSPTRLGAAREIASAFVRGRVSDRIGLVTFGGAPLLACPPTTDYDALLERIGELEPGMTRADGTALGDGLVAAAARLKDAPGKGKVVVLLTDGRSNTGAVDPRTAARTAAALGVRVYAVGAAGRGPAEAVVDDPRHGRVALRIEDDLDEELLAEVARETGGKSYRALSRGQLAGIFAEIDALEKTDVKRPPVVAVADLHAWPLAAAVLLLLAESALAAAPLLRWP